MRKRERGGEGGEGRRGKEREGERGGCMSGRHYAIMLSGKKGGRGGGNVCGHR